MIISYQIPRAGLLWVLISVVMAIAPHATRLPLWISAMALFCIAWRVLIFLGRLDHPGKATRLLVVFFILVVSVTQLRSLEVTLDVAVSILALGFIFKLVEMQSKRDIYVVLCLCFIMALVALIYSQQMLTTMYLTLMVMIVMGSMVSLNRAPGAGYRRTSTLALAVRITAQGLPLMVVLFVIFPRIDPLWAVPDQGTGASTGVNDEMSPGDISRLGRSGDLAFRARFDNGPPPLHENLYWRGLVLDYFDGSSWRREPQAVVPPPVLDRRDQAPAATTSGNPSRYNVTLEPTGQPWVFGLHYSDPLSGSIVRSSNFELFHAEPVTRRFSYELVSYRDFAAERELPLATRSRALQLPAAGNPRSRELASALRAGVATDRDYVYTVLGLFQQEFLYTLTPPLLAKERIDEFLFDTRSGYCEHYAGSFVFMMRAAGIPARVVVGYQGGEFNPYEDYVMVYQYNAHAWTEVWLEGEGWLSIDPTAIVSPERINEGVEAALANDSAFLANARFALARFRGNDWLNTLRLRLDAIEYSWERRIVTYGEERRYALLESWLGQVTQFRVAALAAASCLLVLVVIGLTFWRASPSRRAMALEKVYREFCEALARTGQERRTGEGPLAYCERVAAARPDLAEALAEFTASYMDYSYATDDADAAGLEANLRQLKRQLVRLRACLAPAKSAA